MLWILDSHTGNVGYKAINLFQFNSIVNNAKKPRAPESAGPGETAQFAHCLIRLCLVHVSTYFWLIWNIKHAPIVL